MAQRCDMRIKQLEKRYSLCVAKESQLTSDYREMLDKNTLTAINKQIIERHRKSILNEQSVLYEGKKERTR